MRSLENVILEEHDMLMKVVGKFDKKVTEKGEPIWGSKNKGSNETKLTRVSYASVVGFGVDELDPENSLSGFMEHVPMSLRRWACYPMLLGRVRRVYKHVMLVDVNKVYLLGDPLDQVKNWSPDLVFLLSTNEKAINSGFIMGSIRGIRRLSAAMLTEIVRATMAPQHNKKKSLIMDSGLLSRLVTNKFTLKSISIMTLVASILEASSLSESWMGNQTIVWRENNDKDIDSVIMKYICSYPIDSAVYTDC